MPCAILARMLPGDLVASRFKIEHLASSGGMGVVYHALDLRNGHPVALKFVASGERSQQRRLLQEAAMLETLEHPGIVRHVAHGHTSQEQETFYLAMEWLEGEVLRDRLRRSGLTPLESVRLITIVAKAAGFAHERGVVHRDFKPSNIFLEHGMIDGTKVIDFGIARHQDYAEGLTIPGVAIGTPGYMAPEQASAGRDVDARADIFSLGCVLFECLTGRKAFIANSLMALHAKILMEDPPRLRELGLELPLSLDDLLARMLAKDPERRPADGVALAAELIGLTAEIAAVAPEAAPVTRMGAPATPPSSSAAALTRGEQRLMAVILVDPVGSVSEAPAENDGGSVETAPPKRSRDPNADLAQIVDDFGGRLEVMIGGSLVATLMGGGAATDQSAQAARCALAIRARRPAAQIALAMGRGQITGRWPVGDVIDRAARVLRQYRGGDTPPPSRMNLCGILLDEVTAGLLDMRFEVARDADGAELRGEGEQAKGARKLLGKLTPCVGREGELAVLDSLWNQCALESQACVALVTGPPGIGKSRLLQEFLTRLEKRGESFDIWYGQSDPMRTSSPFGVIAPALRRVAGVIEGEPGEAKQAKLRARVARHVSSADAQLVAEFIGEIAGIPFPHEHSAQLAAARRNGVVMADQRRRAWESFLTAECEAHPVLIVLEDLQWADDPTIKLIEAALRRCAEMRWMVIALARPEELEKRVSNLLAGRRVHSFNLFELSRKASEKLIRSVLGPDVQADTVSGLVERAAGNPFYLEELVRAVAEGKGETLPGTVLAMLHARIESMGSEARRMLRAASIFGKTFWKGGLMALLGGHASAMTDPIDNTRANLLLAQIEETEVIIRSEDSRFSGEEAYAFRHALLQEVAYATLTPEDRALGHRLAGEWLEQAGEREAGVLAEHFDRGEDPERALIWYHRAGEQALLGGDLNAALAWSVRGLAAGAEGTVRGTWK
jgi:eukaryotic-like serine/threonine-protein kinase